MPLEKQLKRLKLEKRDQKTPDMVWVEVPRNRLRRPFPLFWGLLVLGLFAGFAVVTMLQFNRISDDKYYDARVKQWESDIDAHELSVEAYATCVASIDTRQTYRDLFGGVAALLQELANAPAELLPGSEAALIYQERITQRIRELIVEPVDAKLQPRSLADCPKKPGLPPEKPKR